MEGGDATDRIPGTGGAAVKFSRRIVALVAAGILAASTGMRAQAQEKPQTVEEFYRGKQVRVISTGGAMTDYDMYARMITTLMTKYMPGNPTFVVQSMTGGGGIVGTNYLYNVAPHDGSVIGMVARNMPQVALVGDANVKFDPTKFQWLGSPEVSHGICAVVTGAKVQKFEDLLEHELLIGGTGAGSTGSQTATFLNRLLGTKFRLVEGYKTVPDVSLAMIKGEVEAVCQSLAGLKGGNLQGWIEAGKLKVLFNVEEKRIPGLDAPSIFEFAKTDEQKQLLRVFSAAGEIGRPMLVPPNVPADRVRALREAFNKAVNDPEFLEQTKKLNLDITLVKGEEIQKIVERTMSTPKDLVAKFEKMISAK
jgi:tripartite-type tricarboxylate transporter receptor subunit TctC